MIFLAIPLLILFGLLLSQDFFLGVLLTIILLPSYLIRFSIAGIPTTFLEVMVIMVCLFWLIRSRNFKRSKFLIPITLLLIAATIGIVVSPDKFAALGVYKAFYLEPILFFFILIDTYKQPQAKEKIFRALGISSLIVSLFALTQWIFNIGIPTPWDLERRVTGVFEYPNALALFVGPIIILSFFELLREQNRKWKLFWILVGGTGVISIILAQSEASWIAIMATVFLATLSMKRFRKIGLFIAGICLVCIATISPLRSYTLEKLTLSDSSGRVRISQWTETIELLRDHPLAGVGLSGYPIALEPYHKATSLEIFQYPHNFLLNIWVELGLLGLIAFLLLSHQILTTCLTNRSALQSPIPFIFLEMTIHGLVDVPYFKNDLALLTWIFLALFVAEYVGTKTVQANTQKFN